MDHNSAQALLRRLRGTQYDFLRRTYSAFVTARTARTKTSEPAFRFVDLPPEIRNAIYRLLMRRPNGVRIRQFKPPAITRVCKQLRNESLPIFFDVNTFIAEVKTSWFLTVDRHSTRPYGSLPWIGVFVPASHKLYKQVGTLQLRREIISLLKNAGGGTARIKNLDICVLSAIDQYPQTVDYLDMIVSVRSEEGRPKTAAASTYINERHGHYDQEVVKDLRHIADSAKAVLEAMFAKSSFNGLSISELKRVANAFRAEARIGSRVVRV